jgi:hypothetical protein
MRALLTLLLLAIITPVALAKCMARFYVISGSVVDASGAPVSSALVGVSWVEQSSPSGPGMALTDENGLYSIPIRFDTYSGYSLQGDRCHATLNQVSLTAYTRTQRSQPVLVPISKASQVSAAPIQIDRPIEREPLWPDEVGP